jgi:signal peptidase I
MPPAGRSIRPPDLEPAQRERIRSADRRAARRRPLAFLSELPILIIVALLLAFLIKTFLVQAFFIPSGSMIPTLQIGDRVLVEKITYRFRPPERGEIIVFRRPGAEDVGGGVGGALRSFLEGLGLVQPDEDIDLIKRVIGLPGDELELRDGRVYVNGIPLDEAYAQPESRDFGPITVPPERLFMMGDNRMNSDDSRFGVGPVPIDNVVGRAFVILWPPGDATFGLDEDYPAAGERAPPGGTQPAPADPAPTPTPQPSGSR